MAQDSARHDHDKHAHEHVHEAKSEHADRHGHEAQGEHGEKGAPKAQGEHRQHAQHEEHSHAGSGGIQVGVLTCSDRGSRGERADVSGPTLHNLVVDRLGGKVSQYKVVPDERSAIEATLRQWTDERHLDLILTTGGTGFSPRDVTPEATRAVIEREANALVQAMLFESLRITPYAMLSRAIAGIRGRTLIINFPGNPKAISENFGAIAEVLPHAIDIVRGVDTHAQQGAHADHAGGHRESEARDHDSHPHDEHRHEPKAEHAGHDKHNHGAHETAPQPAAKATPTGGIARNVGGPPC